MRPLVVFVSLALFGLMALTGCSQNKAGSPPPAESPDAPSGSESCEVQLSGNLSGSLSLPSCGELRLFPSDDASADVVLGFHFSTTKLQALDVSIALGPTPSLGSYSSQTSPEWSVIGTTSSLCQYVAGSESVPRGSFKLTLSSLELVDAGAEANVDSSSEAEADAGANADSGTDSEAGASADSDADTETYTSAGAAHGTLELTLSVHAPPATDCGAGDVEHIVVDF